MLSKSGIPRLSYAQLFSFQVLYSNNADSRGYANAGTFGLLGRKKGEWKRAILEVDYTMGTLFLQDKDRIIMSETFEEYKRYKAQESSLDDTLVSVRFKSGQWEIMAQNAVEKNALQHLLECIVLDLGPQEAAELGVKKGLVGMDKDVIKYGQVQRRAKTAYKKDERFLLIVPGKLLLFKGMDITGKHVRFVTSLFGASTRLVYGQLEFEVIVPDSKSLNLVTPTAEELTGWIGAIEESSSFANQGLGEFSGKISSNARVDRRRRAYPASTTQEDTGVVGRRKSDPSIRDTRRDDSGGPRQEAFYINRSNDYEGGNYQRSGNGQVERDQRSQVYDMNLEDPVKSRFRKDFIQINDRNVSTSYTGMEQSNPSSLEQSRDRDRNPAFDRERHNNQWLNIASNYQKVSGITNQIEKPSQSHSRDFPDQRIMESSLMVVESADVRRQEGRNFDEMDSQAMFMRQGGSSGQGLISQNQAGSSGAITDDSPASTKAAWEGNCDAFEDRNTRKGQSSLQRISVYPQLNQELPSSSNSTDPTSKSKRRSVKELEKMLFYLSFYRQGLVDSSTQTDYQGRIAW